MFADNFPMSFIAFSQWSSIGTFHGSSITSLNHHPPGIEEWNLILQCSWLDNGTYIENNVTLALVNLTRMLSQICKAQIIKDEFPSQRKAIKMLTWNSMGYLPNFCFISLSNNVYHIAAYLVLPSPDIQNSYQCDSYWDSNGHHSWVLSHTQHHRAGADLMHTWQDVTFSHNHSSYNFVKRNGN
jgi:hypothetical protein